MEGNRIKNRQSAFFRQLFFLASIVAIGLVIFKQLNFFIGSFLGATTLYIVLRNVQFKLVEKKNWKPWLAALCLILAMSVLLMGAGALVYNMIASEIAGFDTAQIIDGLKTLPDKINENLEFKELTNHIIPTISKYLTDLTSDIVNSAYSFTVNVLLMIIILYFMLAHGREMEKKIISYLPFWGKSLELIKHEAKNMIYSNAVGIPIIMFGQGIAAALLYWALGLNNILFWAFLTALAGLIPMIGTVIISAPLGIWLINQGEVWQGIALIILGMLVVANVDNLIRIVLMHKVAHTHPLVVIFGVILGIPVFGFWGIIFGPLLISGFLLLIKIYYVEYGLLDADEAKCCPGKYSHPGQKRLHKTLKAMRKRVKTSYIAE